MKKLGKRFLTMILAIAMCLSLCLIGASAEGGSGSVAINEANFPDAIFREKVSTSFDKDKDGSLSSEEIASITSLNVSSTNISDLTGIEYFTSLELLDCVSARLKSLDVSKNTKLKELQCGGNQLTSLDVSANTALTFLSCNDNQLTNLDVSANTALTYLNCRGNELTSLDVSANTALTGLNCEFNQLTSLDLSTNTALTYLNCDNNQLTSLDMSTNTALTTLYCYRNQLTTLDVSRNTELETLSCYTNQLTSLDVSNNTKLADLNCNENQLTSLNVSKNTELWQLVCGINQLTSLDVSKNTKLTNLSCNDNQLTDLDVSNNTKLTSLSCGVNPLTRLDVSKNTELTDLYCDSNQLTSLDVSMLTKLIRLSCSWNSLTSLDVRANTALTKLDCGYNQLTSLDVRANTALTELRCDSNQLTSLDLSANSELGTLYCGYNRCSLEIPCTSKDDVLSALPVKPNVSKMSNISGATLVNGKLKLDDSDDPSVIILTYVVNYDYDCGNGFTEDFTLEVKLTHSYGSDGVCTGCGMAQDGTPDLEPDLDILDILFTDTDASAYYAEAVLWAVELGITTGTTESTFGPNETCTREQVVTFLWRAYGSPEPTSTSNPFTDVSTDSYAYKAILWAVENGITSGTSATTFSPSAGCTRGQVVTFLWRAAGEPEVSGSSGFSDVSESAYYAKAVAWAVENGITSGTSATTFSPEDTCTRAQIVTFLYRDLA